MPAQSISDLATGLLSENEESPKQPSSLSDLASSVLSGKPSVSATAPQPIPGMEKLGTLPSAGGPPAFTPTPSNWLPSGPSPKAAGAAPGFGENVVRAIGQAVVTPFEQTLSQAVGTRKPPTMEELYSQSMPALVSHAKSAIDTVFGQGTVNRLPQDFPWLEFVGHLANEAGRAGMSILDFARSPLGMVLPEANQILPPAGKAAVGAGFAASMEPGTEQQIRQAAAEPTQQNVARAVVTSAVNALPAAFAIPALIEARRSSPPPLRPIEEAATPAQEALPPLAPPPPMNQAARRATALPPEQGVAEQVSRAVDARNRIAMQLSGKPFAELSNSERLAVDDLVSQGYVGTEPQPPEPAQPQLNLQPSSLPATVATPRRRPAPAPIQPPPSPPATALEVPSAAAPETGAPGSAIIPGKEVPQNEARRPAIESQPIPLPRPPSNPVWAGENTTVRVPGSPVAFEARYAIRDLADVYASHNERNFQPNSEYQYRNDRSYAEPEAANRVISNSREGTFDPAYIVNTNPDAVNGPPIIDHNGNVLGGNSRAMILGRVYADSPKAADAYRTALIQQATQFGLNPDDIAQMRRPVLVRELTRELSPQETQQAITQFNQVPTAALRPAERAIADSRGLSSQTLDYLSGKIEEQGPDATLAQTLEGRGGPEIVNRLVEDGVITTQERPQYIDERGVLTQDGKQRISRLLIGRLFENPDSFENTPPSLRNKLERVVAPLARLQARPDWDLTPQVQEALNVLEEARAHGISNLQDLAGQQDLFGNGPRIAPDVLALAQRLHDDGPRKLAQAFNQYTQDERLSRPGEPATFIEPPSREQAFADAFGNRGAGEVAGGSTLSGIASDLLRSERGSSPLDPLGVGQFAREDILPALRKATAAAVDAVDQARSVVAPQTRGPAAGDVALSLRHGAATMVRAYDQEVSALEPFRRLFRIGFRDQEADIGRNRDFINRMERGLPQATPQLDAAAQIMRTGLDSRREMIQGLGTGKLQDFDMDYFPHFWERPPETIGQAVGRIGGKRPLQGPASFLKQRVFETTQDGIDAGFKPLTEDPVQAYLWKAREMDRYLMAHQFLQEQKGLGLAKFVKSGATGPDGWEPLPDPIGNVYYRTDAGELVSAGNYYMPSDAAQVVSNFLSPGLRGNPLFRAWLGTGNLLLRARLGLSAFHGGFSALTADISQFALSFEKALAGDMKGAASAAIRTPLAFIDDLRNGGRYMQEWNAPGTTDPKTAQLVNAYEAGGGRARMDQFYATQITGRMMDAARRGNVLGALLRLPGAAIETASKPIMTWMVPRMKVAAFSKLMDMELERLGPDAPQKAIERAAASIVDTVDNRYGQLVYDNQFFNKAVKDIGMSSVQSLGWNLGTFKLALGGAKKLGQAAVNREVNPENFHNAAFLLALPIVHAAAGSILNYLSTGQPPQDVRDAFFPRTGRLDEHQRPERWFLPTYVKDAVHFAESPGKALANKLHPIISTTYDMLTNKDYWGTEIRHGDDPLVQQALEPLKFLGTQFEPYSAQGIQKMRERGVTGPQLAAPFFGLAPAPSYINQSAAERLASEYIGTHAESAPRTQQQFDRSRAMSQVVNALRQKKDVGDMVRGLLSSGTLAPSDIAQIRRRAVVSPLASQVARLTLEQALHVYQAAEPAEQAQIKTAVRRKAIAAMGKPYQWSPRAIQLSQKYLGIAPRTLPNGLRPLAPPPN